LPDHTIGSVASTKTGIVGGLPVNSPEALETLSSAKTRLWVTIDVMVRICGHDLTHTSGANEIEREILD
jgi:hypothetical protein